MSERIQRRIWPVLKFLQKARVSNEPTTKVTLTCLCWFVKLFAHFSNVKPLFMFVKWNCLVNISRPFIISTISVSSNWTSFKNQLQMHNWPHWWPLLTIADQWRTLANIFQLAKWQLYDAAISFQLASPWTACCKWTLWPNFFWFRPPSDANANQSMRPLSLPGRELIRSVDDSFHWNALIDTVRPATRNRYEN